MIMKSKKCCKKSRPWLIIVFIVLFILLVVGIVARGDTTRANLNEKLNVINDDISIVVKSVEEVTLDSNSEVSLINGNYVKIDLEITNNGNHVFEWNRLWNFRLINSEEETVSMAILSTTDVDGQLATVVNSNETESGSIYFKTELNDDFVLQYRTNDYLDAKSYYINLKK